MKSEDFLINHLNRISSVFPEIRIRYEHRRECLCHIIEIIPETVFHDDLDYIKTESDLESEFEKLFPDEEIIFITADSLLEIKEVVREFGYFQLNFDLTKGNYVTILNGFDDCLNNMMDNFALAA
jgi:hypothetical protein